MLFIGVDKPSYEKWIKSANREQLIIHINDLGAESLFLIHELKESKAALDRAATKISDLTCRPKDVIINELMKGESK